MARFILIWTIFLPASALAQVWEVPRSDREILIDGFVDEWEGVPEILLAPEDSSLRKTSNIEDGDVRVKVQGLWNERYLYLALTWEDETWDVEEVTRGNAVWIDADKKRRDRMFFYDYLKLHIRESDYDYTLWLSPRAGEEGPFFWHRLLEGYRGMERAAGTPMVTAREDGSRCTVEIMLLWQQLKLEARAGNGWPVNLIVSDSDHPGRLLDYKLDHLKWLAWTGELRLGD